MDFEPSVSRRRFLRFLLGSAAWLAARPAVALESTLGEGVEGVDWAPSRGEPVARVSDAVDIFDLRRAARERLSRAHWEFLSQGVERGLTLEANRNGFERFALRPRRLVDVREVDTSTELFGQPLKSPILLSPCGAQEAFHPEGEVAVARAARDRGHVQILSTMSSRSLEEVIEARGEPVWFQLYTPRVWPATWLQLEEAEAAGCPVVALTIDSVGGTRRLGIERFRRPDNPQCGACHPPTLDRIAESVLGSPLAKLASLDWDYVDRIRDKTSMKLVLKGVLGREDAELAVEHGVDGILVSNHGGRVVDSGLSTVEVLPEVVAAVDGRIPVVIDSGFRRGSDFYKALALGADAVCIGRPYLWGLGAFGQQGVDATLALLQTELETLMRQMGTPRLADITASSVRAL